MKSLENGMLVNLPKGKFASIFERVILAVNTRKSKAGGALPWSDVKVIMDDLGIPMKDWYTALARAKKVQPNTYEMFYRAFGRSVPTPRGSALMASKNSRDDVAVDGVEEVEGPEVIAATDALAAILGWLDRVPAVDRMRIITTIEVYYDEGSKT